MKEFRGQEEIIPSRSHFSKKKKKKKIQFYDRSAGPLLAEQFSVMYESCELPQSQG